MLNDVLRIIEHKVKNYKQFLNRNPLQLQAQTFLEQKLTQKAKLTVR